MSLFSRNTGGGRRGLARMAAVFAGTLFVYLIATAIPASAATTCASATVDVANDEMVVAVGTDDHVIIAPIAGVWDVSINGAAFVGTCPGTATVAAVQWINVTGSDAGAETVTAYDPNTAFNAINTTINLGNGTDTVVFDYAAIGGPPSLPDTGVGADLGFGTAGDGSVNGGDPISGTADFRITGAENLTVNGSNSLVSGDSLDLSDTSQSGFSVVTGTADDTLDTVTPVAVGVTYNAGSGDDMLVSGDGADNFQGGPGADTVSYAGASAGVTADLTASTGTGQGNDTLSDVQNVTGSDFADTITGNILDNVLMGGGGSDTIDGGAGNDTIDGEAGDDTLTGGTGDDSVSGSGGDDTVNEDAAANGMDVLSGGVGGEIVGDTLDYGARTTDIVVNAGAGAVSGAAGEKDTVDGTFENYITGSGNDTLTGGAGSEFFDPGSGTNTVDGDGGGADYLDLSSQTGPATIDLSGGAGTATAGTTVDTFMNIEGVVGTAADDTLNWDGTGALLDFIGGAGVDTVDASASTGGVVIDLTTFTGGATAGSVENVVGGSGDDTLIGNNLYNTLTGNDGNDILSGLFGDDHLFGGNGNDFISGGLGNDSVSGGLGDDTMSGDAGADTLVFDRAGHGVNVDNQLGFATGQGSDSISFFEIVKGTNSKDTIIGGQTAFDGNNRYFGFGGDDLLIGTNSTDVINGGGGDDSIRGGGGDDILHGASGSDKLYGSIGDDILFGGKGPDWGWGGAGNDSCHSIKFQNSC